jgi:MFS transporter, ACS family, tartrate transporter
MTQMRAEEVAEPAELRQTYRKITFRLLPFLFACYVIAYVDRINVGFAKLQMQDDLALSGAAYGLGAGIFFVGYVLFEIPSNIGMEKFGARKTLMRIMLLWGLASAATALVQTPEQFYVVRFLVGAFEAGFAPGVLLYLTYWYSPQRRAGAMSKFLSAAAVAGIIGSPVSGWILQGMDGLLGAGGWRWMFLLEGIPAVVLGILVIRVLPNRPQEAPWLTCREKELLSADLAPSQGHQQHRLGAALRQPQLYLFAYVYFSLLLGVYLISFWLPTLVNSLGDYSESQVGLLTMLPFIGAFAAMILVGSHSDRMGEHRWHIAVSAGVGMLALVVSTSVDNPLVSMLMFVIATAGLFAAFPIFWPIPSMFFTGVAAAGAIAFINSIGTSSGFVAPYVAGWITDLTGSIDYFVYMGAVVLALGMIALFWIVPREIRPSSDPNVAKGEADHVQGIR